MASIDATVSTQQQQSTCNVLLGVTGSVAAVKAPEIACRLYSNCNANVKILLSEGGRFFWEKSKEYDLFYWNQLQQILTQSSSTTQSTTTSQQQDSSCCDTKTIQLIYAEEEWKGWHQMGDSVLHIELRNWADILVLAPLSAHFLAKLANGLCDDTLSCVARAWDYGHYQLPATVTAAAAAAAPQQLPLQTSTQKRRVGKPVLLAPAMNTAMWEHPLTQQHINAIQSFGETPTREESASTLQQESIDLVHIIAPQTKLLACGEVGVGALASVESILTTVQNHVHKYRDSNA